MRYETPARYSRTSMTLMEIGEIAVEVRQDGWIVGPQGRLLLHVPTMHLPGLVRARTKRLILVDATELDLSNFAHGPSWQACRRGGVLGL